jgi:3',5'-cyclic AMP phosphodiesterase CpdA
MVRLAHISDLHLTATPLGWQARDWLTKRAFTRLNLFLRRGHHFGRAEHVLTSLAQELQTRQIDHVVFSGDATALGFEAELCRVAQILGVSQRPGLAVPGNHDYCIPRVARSGAFERCFGAWQHGDRQGTATYPFAQRVGHVWLIGVNSAKGNFWFWDATGRVGAEQLERLRQLLARLPAGPRILVTHYPVCLADCRRERFAHGLRDLDATVNVAREGGICLWLHGHRHGFYHLQNPPQTPFPIICAGSSTQSGLWSYGEYVIEDTRLLGTRRVFDPSSDGFRDAETFELTLPVAAGHCSRRL